MVGRADMPGVCGPNAVSVFEVEYPPARHFEAVPLNQSLIALP